MISISASGADRRSFRFERFLCLGDDGRKRGGIGDREVREDLAVGLNASGFETFDEARIGQSLGANGSVDPLRPQPAELAFATLPVAVFIGHRLADGVLGVTEEFRAESAETLGTQQHALATLAAGR